MAVKPLVLVGQMGVGKTTVGRIVAQRLERPFYDSDVQIEAATGATGREIAGSEGVDVLHDLESAALAEAVGSDQRAVVAAAASVVDDPFAVELLADVVCVWIDRDVGPDRWAGKGHRRDVGDFEHLERRRPIYDSIADLVLAGDGDAGDYADRVIRFLDDRA